MVTNLIEAKNKIAHETKGSHPTWKSRAQKNSKGSSTKSTSMLPTEW